MRIIILVIVMAGLFNTPYINAQNQYPPLTGRHTMCTSNPPYDCDEDTRNKSEVELYSPSQKELDEFFSYWNKFYKHDIRKELIVSDGWYIYTYTFENYGKYKVKLNFSEWSFIHSPVTTILQDFSLSLNPGEIRIIKFFTPGKPTTVVSAVNAGFWEQLETGKWEFAGIGRAGLYVPPGRSTCFMEVK